MKKKLFLFLLIFVNPACPCFDFLCGCFCVAPKKTKNLYRAFLNDVDGQRTSYEWRLARLLNPTYKCLIQHKRLNSMKKLAVVFDIDGTLFYANSRVVNRAMLDYYNYFKSSGFYCVIISSRLESSLDKTKAELDGAGFRDWTDLILMPENYAANLFECDLSEIYKSLEQANFDLIGRWKEAQRKNIEDRLNLKVVATFDDHAFNLKGESLGIPFRVPSYLELLNFV